eukprot:scaffold52280_cov61-Phaeocystis_antarctica.AAC.3
MGDDRNESCGICKIAGPRSVRFLPCGHRGICELCTVKCVKANGLICTNCRCAVSKLAVMPVTMATVAAGQVPQPQRMPTPGGAGAGGPHLRERRGVLAGEAW